ncbi:MAG: putative porin, partial [Cryomorphaceae bacterium]
GLQSDTYNLADDAGAFGALNNDVFLSSAFNRSTDLRVQTDVEYTLTKKLNLTGIGRLKQQRFLYDDERGDQSYYDAFRNDTSLSRVRDSNKVFIWSTGARASYVIAQDASKSQKVHLTFLHHAIRYRSMEATQFTTNTTVSAQFLSVGTSTSLDVLGRAVIAGYNAGDIQLKGVLNHALSNVPAADSMPSVAGKWSAKFKLAAQRYEPYVIYSRYRSSYLNWTSDLTKTTAVDMAGGLVRSAAKGGAEFRLTSQWRDGLVYLNEDLEVTQSLTNIALVGVEVQGDLAAKGFELAGIARYQLNVLSKVYDLPMISASGEFSYAFPMFNKSIYIQAGAGASYFSDYRARAYAPFMDVYYLQRNARFGNYLQLDPFMRASVQSVDVTLRLINGAYGLFGSQAMIAPGYPTVPRFLEIRIDWVFKN